MQITSQLTPSPAAEASRSSAASAVAGEDTTPAPTLGSTPAADVQVSDHAKTLAAQTRSGQPNGASPGSAADPYAARLAALEDNFPKSKQGRFKRRELSKHGIAARAKSEARHQELLQRADAYQARAVVVRNKSAARHDAAVDKEEAYEARRHWRKLPRRRT